MCGDPDGAVRWHRREHNPRKLEDVDQLLEEWHGEEDKLLEHIQDKCDS